MLVLLYLIIINYTCLTLFLILNMSYPRISLVTGCYNHERYIGETIESVISQGYPELQYIVINDGSTDNSEKEIKKYAKYLSHWETWPGKRETIVPALNKGFTMTNGEIMGWLNSKNILLPKSLFVIAEVFSQLPDIEWLTGMATTTDHSGRLVQVRRHRKSKYDYLIGDWRVIQQESTFWRRSIWDKTDNHLTERWAFDSELWARFFLETELYHLETVLGAYRRIPNAQSIQNKDQFRKLTEKSISRMRLAASKKDLRDAALYRVLKHGFKYALRNIPNRLYIHLPILKKYAYKKISYDFTIDSWRIESENPFKTKS